MTPCKVRYKASGRVKERSFDSAREARAFIARLSSPSYKVHLTTADGERHICNTCENPVEPMTYPYICPACERRATIAADHARYYV